MGPYFIGSKHMYNDKVKNTTRTNEHVLSKTEARAQAKQIIGVKDHKIKIEGDENSSNKNNTQDKIEALAISLLRQSEIKVTTQNAPVVTKNTSATGTNKSSKSGDDPLDTLSRVQDENNDPSTSNDDNAFDLWLKAQKLESLKTASYYILTSTFKSLSEKFVNMFRGEAKKKFQSSPIYILEKANAVKSIDNTSAA